jgi:hypothetical protein
LDELDFWLFDESVLTVEFIYRRMWGEHVVSRLFGR